jgi:hypothetical protein
MGDSHLAWCGQIADCLTITVSTIITGSFKANISLNMKSVTSRTFLVIFVVFDSLSWTWVRPMW